jgi:hypothetical protein
VNLVVAAMRTKWTPLCKGMPYRTCNLDSSLLSSEVGISLPRHVLPKDAVSSWVGLANRKQRE